MLQNSGGSVAKHKHNKKQSGTFPKPFINKEKERKKCDHWEQPREAMRQCCSIKNIYKYQQNKKRGSTKMYEKTFIVQLIQVFLDIF